MQGLGKCWDDERQVCCPFQGKRQMGNLHHTQTKEGADNDLHPSAQGGSPEHGNREQGEEVINEDVADHSEVSHRGTGRGANVARGATACTKSHGEDGGNECPQDHDHDADDEDDLGLETTGKTIQHKGHGDLDDAGGDVEGILVHRIELPRYRKLVPAWKQKKGGSLGLLTHQEHLFAIEMGSVIADVRSKAIVHRNETKGAAKHETQLWRSNVVSKQLEATV